MILILSCVIAGVVITLFLSPLKFDLGIGLTPNWLRKESKNHASTETVRLSAPIVSASTPGSPIPSDDVAPDLLTITIDRGTPVTDQ